MGLYFCEKFEINKLELNLKFLGIANVLSFTKYIQHLEKVKLKFWVLIIQI